MNAYEQLLFTVLLVIATNQNMFQANIVPSNNENGDTGTLEQSAAKNLRLTLLGKTLLHSDVPSQKIENMYPNDGNPDGSENENIGTERALVRQKRRYTICDVKHPTIYEFLEFLRTRKLCGMKTRHFRFGGGK